MYTSWPERPPWKYYKLKELPFVTWLGQQLDRNVYRGGTTLHCYKERCLPVCYFCLKRQYLVYTMVCSLLKTIPQILKGCNKITLACQSSTKFLSLNIIKSESKGPILVYVIEQPRQLKLIPFLCVCVGGERLCSTCVPKLHMHLEAHHIGGYGSILTTWGPWNVQQNLYTQVFFFASTRKMAAMAGIEPTSSIMAVKHPSRWAVTVGST